MSSDSKSRLVDDLSDQVESRVKNLAVTAARSAVRKLWNTSFASAIEHEITALYNSSLKEVPEKKPEKSVIEEKSSRENVGAAEGGTAANGQGQGIHVAEQAPNQTPSENPVQKIDKIFIEILEDFASDIMGLTRQSTEYILDVSNSFMDDNTQSTLQDFHDLYFGQSNELTETSKQVNDEVDGIVDSLQEKIKNGEEISESDVAEEQDDKTARLSLSGLQKRLETIISLDAGIKDKLIPVLHSMQFEDFLSQRLTHIKKIWRTILDREEANSELDIEELKESLSKLPTSVNERDAFYKIVLKREAPEEPSEKKDIMDFLF